MDKKQFANCILNQKLIVDNNVQYHALEYIDHPEVSTVYAIQISPKNIYDDMDHDKIVSYMDIITHSDWYQVHAHPVTYLHLYMAHVSLFRYLMIGNNYYNPVGENINNTNINFPKNLTEYYVY